MASLTCGDLLIVTKLDRLARSTRDLLNTLAVVADKGAGFKVLAAADSTPAAATSVRSSSVCVPRIRFSRGLTTRHALGDGAQMVSPGMFLDRLIEALQLRFSLGNPLAKFGDVSAPTVLPFLPALKHLIHQALRILDTSHRQTAFWGPPIRPHGPPAQPFPPSDG
jgi:hypothetical protein